MIIIAVVFAGDGGRFAAGVCCALTCGTAFDRRQRERLEKRQPRVPVRAQGGGHEGFLGRLGSSCDDCSDFISADKRLRGRESAAVRVPCNVTYPRR